MAKLYRRPPRWTPALGALLCCALAAAALADGTHGLSLFGDLKYRPDFKNFDYVNPNAPKGGTMKFSAIGTYDTFNPYVVKGLPAAGIGGIFDTLTVASEDEPGSEYGLVAQRSGGDAILIAFPMLPALDNLVPRGDRSRDRRPGLL